MIDVQYNVDLARHTTFGISAKCDIFAEYDTVDDLVQLLCSPELQKVPIINIGEGSNILFVSDFNGAVLHSRIYGIEIIFSETEMKVTGKSEFDMQKVISPCWRFLVQMEENGKMVDGEILYDAVTGKQIG